MHDIIIIGAGTAGMTAAIYGLRAGKSVLLIEAENFGGQITFSPQIENYPGIAKISGDEFATNLLEQAVALGADTILEQVTEVRPESVQKVVVTKEKEYPCKSIIIATGVKHRHLGLKREAELAGAGVSYCAICDGPFFKGRKVAVVGGGNTALEDAMLLSNTCEEVFLIHRRDTFRGDNHLIQRLQRKENVTVILDTVIKGLQGTDSLEMIELLNKKDGETTVLPVEGLFVAIGQVPNNEMFAEVVKLNEDGYVLAAEDCMTSGRGIYVAGDCRTKEVRQLTTAAADGAVAALAACTYIDQYTTG
ncbi:MAG: thioredoxin-disulfide reductase [Lachnospiraceae bacterium]